MMLKIFRKLYLAIKLLILLCISGALPALIIYYTLKLLRLNSFAKKIYRFIPAILIRLGPAFVKFAQILSTRKDVCNPDILPYLTNLQQRSIRPHASRLKNILAQEYSPAILASLDIDFQHCHCASLAHVYKAKNLLNGNLVALKVIYPIQRKRYMKSIEMCEFALSLIMNLLQMNERLRLREAVDVVRQTATTEVNMYLEAAAIQQLRENEAKHGGHLSFPFVYWEFTTTSILCMDWINGESVNRIINSVDIKDRKSNEKFETGSIKDSNQMHHENSIKSSVESLIKILVSSFFHQVFYDGLFHADIHPGNIIIDINHHKITLIDSGMIGFLSTNDRIALGEIFYYFTKLDYNQVAKTHFRAHYVPRSQSERLFALACRSIAEPIFGKKNQDISITQLLSRMHDVTAMFSMEIQPQLLLLQKTLLTLDGVINSLSPNINMWEILVPWFEQWGEKNLSRYSHIKRKIEMLISRYIEY